MKKAGELILVGTPIGNLADFSPRAQKALEQAEVIFCEDTRRFQNLVKGRRIKIKAEICSFFREKEAKSTIKALDFLKKSKKVVLVSDGGLPLVADPGQKLVAACRSLGIQVTAIPGPTAFVLALLVSGLFFDTNMTIGYLPKKRGKVKKIFQECQKVVEVSSCQTFSFYESPHRLVKTLKILKEVLGNIKVFLGLELTKINETHQLQPVSNLIQLYERKKPKGEITVVFSLSK